MRKIEKTQQGGQDLLGCERVARKLVCQEREERRDGRGDKVERHVERFEKQRRANRSNLGRAKIGNLLHDIRVATTHECGILQRQCDVGETCARGRRKSRRR